MAVATELLYITSSESILGGEPVIRGTRTPVRAIIELYRLGIMPEEIPTHLPHLSLAEVFAALSYFSDHQGEIESYISKNQIPEDLAVSE